MKTLQFFLFPLRWLSKIMAAVVTSAVLTLVYIFGIGPLALLGRLFGKDFIGAKRRPADSYWLHYKGKEPTLENFSKPY